MTDLNFSLIKTAVAKQFAEMSKQQIFRVQLDKDELWKTYLGAFPEGTNPIYKTRTEHDCNCCKQFVRAVGDAVIIKNGRISSIWDTKVKSQAYQAVLDAMAAYVQSKAIANVFLHYEATAGTNKSFHSLLDGKVGEWNHFFVNIPANFVKRNSDIASALSEIRSKRDVFLRALKEIDQESIDTVLDLIAQNSLYRGQEHKYAVTEFSKLKKQAQNLNDAELDLFVWQQIATTNGAVTNIRNSVIGTLLTDLSEGKDIEDAVKAFESKVAPSNYKRPTALVSKKMIENARKQIEELGLTSALERRYASINDIQINNILYANRDARRKINSDVFDEIASSVKASKKNLDKVEEVSIDKFIADILPRAESIEVMVENSHTANLVSLIAPVDPSASQMFKWNNGFSWSYNGDMADSIKERVKQAGGSIEGDLLCRLAWDYADDLDFHMYEPNGGHIYFSNRRSMSSNGGMLDVDANGIDGIKENPVENIFYRSKNMMKEGVYELKVHNYYRRSSGVGFQVEIEMNGKTHTISYDKALSGSSTISIAKIRYSKKNGLEIIESLPSTESSKKVWNINTHQFQKVNVIMNSPNYWDGQGVGNKHYFFMLENCVNDGTARGFYNEFLREEMNQHRKVLEIVGSKMRTQETENQLSGVGFSSTQRNSILCKVTGSFSRTVKIVF